MKRMKNLLSLVLALVMVMAMTLPALAATVINKTNHPYDAYQIFSADFYDEIPDEIPGEESKEPPYDEGEILSNLKWGESVNVSALLATLTDEGNDYFGDDNPFASVTNIDSAESAKAVAEILSEGDAALAGKFAKFVAQKYENGAYLYLTTPEAEIPADVDGTVELKGGYYLFIDKVAAEEKADYVNLNLLEVTGPNDTITIRPKNDIPKVDKAVANEAGDAPTNWSEATDHAINESFQFKLTATIPASVHLENYDTYLVTFNDSMSPGVTFESIASVSVICDEESKPVSRKAEKNAKEGYYLTSGDTTENQTNLDDVYAKIASSFAFSLTIDDIKQYLSADFDGTKDVTVEVVYNAHLNPNAVVKKPTGGYTDEQTNNNTVKLEYSNNPNDEGKGKTAPDTVWVFTYEMPNFKYTTHKGAEGNDVDDPKEGAGFTLYKDDGKTVVALVAQKDITGDVLWYRPATPDEEAAINGDKDITKKFEITSLENGRFDIRGLDAGTYILKETTTPPGYNTCADITVNIEVEGLAENTAETGANVTVTMTNSMNGATNVTENKIVNQKGVTLPETGGIGTTIFTVSGIILVIIAGVLLVTKKRMSKEE